MKVVCLDFGNTFCKAATIENDQVVSTFHFLLANALQEITQILNQFLPTHTIYSSVLHPQIDIISFVKQHSILVELTYQTALPFINKYDTPNTLGKDRLALIAQASAQFPNQNTLIISAGTCVTYNFINHNNEFIGGGISPGLQMRLKAMHHYTQMLPLAENKQKPLLIGTDTIGSIQSGAINGLRAEIDETIHAYELEFQKINVVLTGGDMPQLALLLKRRIFADADFLFKGLYTILQFHNS